MKPIIKYRGGKTKEIALFEQYLPHSYDHYIEPFFGGGALYFHLEPKKAIINDINSRLMNFYSEIQGNFNEVSKQLTELHARYEHNQALYEELKKSTPDQRVVNENEALYYSIRDMFNYKVLSPYLDAVLYFFINKTAYSGMIRYNAKGEFNVPFGRYKNFNTQLLTTAHHSLLQSACIHNQDYAAIFDLAQTKDFMFLDPPYDCIFNDYGNEEYVEGFGESEHRRLGEDFKNLTCKALMVIGKTPLTVEIYQKYIKDEYFKSYAVNIRNRFKSQTQHLVIANY